MKSLISVATNLSLGTSGLPGRTPGFYEIEKSYIARTEKLQDLFIIGGGINGCGIARDAAGRGYSVSLAEMNDLASGTSSASTKLIHGGLRYLERLEFRLVRESLTEREVLWTMAPHIIRPLRFVLPHQKGRRSRWLLRLGLFLYDALGGRGILSASRKIHLERDVSGKPLAPEYTIGFEYSDCWVDDSRLVVLNARDAADHGAFVMTRTKVIAARRDSACWVITTERNGVTTEHCARMVINATGPWVNQVHSIASGEHYGVSGRVLRLVQGSHIVVPKLFDHGRCYILQNGDGRIVFAIPYEQEFTLIGTTDTEYRGDPGAALITDGEVDYLCSTVNEYFARKVSPADVVWAFSGVRPLFDDGSVKAQEATRDYVLQLDRGDDHASPPLLNIFGGKITTYRRLAEAVLNKVGAAIGTKGETWTSRSPLPGGNFEVNGIDEQIDALLALYPFLPRSDAECLIARYGTDARTILGAARSLKELGKYFGAGLTEAEVRHLRRREWAITAEDVLWRRTKLGLRLSVAEVEALERFLCFNTLDGHIRTVT